MANAPQPLNAQVAIVDKDGKPLPTLTRFFRNLGTGQELDGKLSVIETGSYGPNTKQMVEDAATANAAFACGDIHKVSMASLNSGSLTNLKYASLNLDLKNFVGGASWGPIGGPIGYGTDPNRVSLATYGTVTGFEFDKTPYVTSHKIYHEGILTFGSGLTYNAGTGVLTASGGSSTPWYWNPPLASSFTLSNAGGATNMVLTDDADCGLIIEPGSFAAGTLSNAFAFPTTNISSPTANFTLTGRFEGSTNNEFEYNGFGFVLYESSTNKMIQFWFQRTYTNYGSIAVGYWNSPTSYNSDQRILHNTKHPWIRIVHASGTYTFQISSCGKRWITIFSASDTAFLAGRADKVGLAMGCARNTDIYWQYTCQNYSLV